MRIASNWATAPKSVRAGATALGVVSVYHLAIVLVTALLQPQLHHDLAAAHPEASAAAIDQMVTSATTLSLSVHIPLLVLTAVLAGALPSGHPLALRPATVSQLFGIVFAHASTPPLTVLQPLVPFVIALQALVIALLWLPEASRRHFAAHPRSRTSKRRLRTESSKVQ